MPQAKRLARPPKQQSHYCQVAELRVGEERRLQSLRSERAELSPLVASRAEPSAQRRRIGLVSRGAESERQEASFRQARGRLGPGARVSISGSQERDRLRQRLRTLKMQPRAKRSQVPVKVQQYVQAQRRQSRLIRLITYRSLKPGSEGSASEPESRRGAVLHCCICICHISLLAWLIIEQVS